MICLKSTLIGQFLIQMEFSISGNLLEYLCAFVGICKSPLARKNNEGFTVVKKYSLSIIIEAPDCI